jgi:hypothetical protein
MKRLFISQPMGGKTVEKIYEEREKAIKQALDLCDELVVVINTVFEEDPPKNVKNSALYFLGRSLELLATADIAYFAEEWQEARGCLIEHECCVKYGIKIIGE